MSAEEQKHLQKLAAGDDPLKYWAIRQLAKLLVEPTGGDPGTVAEKKEADPQPATKTLIAGTFGNCEDCQKPINNRSKRQPFRSHNEAIIYTCLDCANVRWRKIHGTKTE